MKCKVCGKSHDHRIHMEDSLQDKGFPTHDKRYETAHRKANQAEKKRFGEKAFKALDKIEHSLKKHELLGKNTKTGKIEVEVKVPKKLREEVAFHEEVENKILRKRKK